MEFKLNTILYFTIGLVVIAIVLIYVTDREIISAASRNLSGEFLIVPVVDSGQSAAEATKITGGYSVELKAKLAFLNPESLKNELTDDPVNGGNIKVVPIVSFKGGAAVGDPFTLNKQRMIEKSTDYIGIIQGNIFEIKTTEPPIKKYDQSPKDDRFVNNYQVGRIDTYGVDDIKEKEAFILKPDNGGEFLVKVEEYDEDTDLKKIVNDPFSSKYCYIAFQIRCQDEIKALRLDEKKDCILMNDGTNDIYECSDNLAVCDGMVEIMIKEKKDDVDDHPLRCKKENIPIKRSNMQISVKGGKYDEQAEGKLSEEIAISFWRKETDPNKTDCIEGETDYRRLVGICGKERLSGLYVYPVPLIA
ncbi:MAG: hypothetical protein QMD85_00160 [Candidatus Aenigmarchaeota archaeon]|nr:hypothetical protein [Candidatus Aenigmarchaeota archaeon]MDI6721940.1 hypothetical protein [Candidatus Aenigmarchaeota archaeon]